MNIQTIKTRRITPGLLTLEALIDESVTALDEGSVVVISSKIVSLCQSNVVSIENTDREELIKRQAEYYLPKSASKYGHHFTIKFDTLIASAGIDASNGNGHYVLWPQDPWATADDIRRYIASNFGIKNIGVIISDSTSQPLRLGVTGISLAHSGFAAIHNYIGQQDLFGHTLRHSRANISHGLAAAAVVTMGEGTEQTPIAVISDIPFVEFQDRRPTEKEVAELNVPLKDDLFEPFLSAVEWEKLQD